MGEEEKKYRVGLKEGESQKAELQNMLDEMTQESKSHVVSEPSFLKTASSKRRVVPRVLSASKTAASSAAESMQAMESSAGDMSTVSTPEGAAQLQSSQATPDLTPTETASSAAAPDAQAISEPVPEEAAPAPSQIPSNFLETQQPTGDFYKDLQIFLVQMQYAFAKRYQTWEETYTIILEILRKMQKVQEKNTQILLEAIEALFKKIMKGFSDFIQKRDEVEKFSEIDYKQLAKQFKKTLELLNFQIREFKLKQSIDELFEIYIQ